MIGLTTDSPATASEPLMQTLCRDCAALFSYVAARQRCDACHAPRLISHGELAALAIAHIDCDAFFAAIEKRDNPSLADKPLIIGGGTRGVVSTACYIARIHGVHSAMPMFRARKACPDAVIIRPDIKKYAAAGRQIRAIMQQWTPLVQAVSIDEAFLDLHGTEQLHHAIPAQSLIKIAAQIKSEIGITVSVGLSHNKFLAKLASDMEKPRGFTLIGRAETQTRLAPLAITDIWGVGASLARALKRDGITHVHHVQTRSKAAMIKRYDKTGSRLFNLAYGIDDRPVKANPDPPKSISHETTFAQDISDPETLEKHLWLLSEKTAARAKAQNIAAFGIVLKLKSDSFKTITRNTMLSAPTQLADTIFTQSANLLARCIARAPLQAYRLIGVGMQTLVSAEHADPLDIVDTQKSHRIKAEHAIDELRQKFGHDAIKKGRSL